MKKKQKLKAVAKTERKVVKLFIEDNLIEKMKTAITELGHNPKSVKGYIEKASRRIAKKLSENAKIKPATMAEDVSVSDNPSSKEDENAAIKPVRKRQIKTNPVL
jgi:hypothetical protein